MNKIQALKLDKKNGYYVDKEDGYHHVFGSDSGFSYGHFNSEEEAHKHLKTLPAQKNEEAEQIDELDRQAGSIINRYLSRTNPDYSTGKENEKRKAGRDLALKKKWGDMKYGFEEPKVKAVTRIYEEINEAMKLDKVNIVHANDDASEKFAKEYVKAHKGDYTDGGPTEKHEKDSEKFHSTYKQIHAKSGFAGSGNTTYQHNVTGEKFNVDRRPNGKTFYGTDHIVTKLHEDIHQIDEISKKTLGSYVRKASDELDKDWDDTRNGKTGLSQNKVVNRFAGIYKARAKNANEAEERTMSIQKIIQESMNEDPMSLKESLIEELTARIKDVIEAKMNSENIEESFSRGDMLHIPGAEGTKHPAVHLGKKAVYLDDDGDVEEVPASALKNAVKMKSVSANHKLLAKNYLDNMNEEAEQIDEISADTVKSYAKKSFDQANIILKRSLDNQPSSVQRASAAALARRKSGIKNAGKRLDKETMQDIADTARRDNEARR